MDTVVFSTSSNNSSHELQHMGREGFYACAHQRPIPCSRRTHSRSRHVPHSKTHTRLGPVPDTITHPGTRIARQLAHTRADTRAHPTVDPTRLLTGIRHVQRAHTRARAHTHSTRPPWLMSSQKGYLVSPSNKCSWT